jgi:4-oxalocrotonate tautomerase
MLNPALPLGAPMARSGHREVHIDGRVWRSAAAGGRVTVLVHGHHRSGHRRQETPMPLIQVKLIENVFSADQKQEIIRKLTDAMVEIEGENMRPVTWCVVEEVASGDWGIAGNPLTTADVKALAAGVGVS